MHVSLLGRRLLGGDSDFGRAWGPALGRTGIVVVSAMQVVDHLPRLIERLLEGVVVDIYQIRQQVGEAGRPVLASQCLSKSSPFSLTRGAAVCMDLVCTLTVY